MSVLKEFLLRKGVRIFKNTLIDNFVLEGEKIKKIFFDGQHMEFDEYVFALDLGLITYVIK